MRLKTFALALTALSLSIAALAQQGAVPEFSPEAFRAHVTFLSDDLLEGRNTGSRGYEIAARYVATQYEALGLKPGLNGSWYQQVPFLEYKLAEGPSRLTIGGQSYDNGTSVLIGASPAEANTTLEAPVVFAGYGLDLPSQGFADYKGLDVKGKVVAVLGGIPEGMPSDVAAHAVRDRVRMAGEHGAVGIITIRNRAEMQRVPWARLAQRPNNPAFAWVAPDGQPFLAAPSVRFTATLDTPAAEALFAGARTPLSKVLDEAARAGAKPKGFALKQSVKLERQSVTRNLTSPNVVAVLPGSDPALANEYVLLMAHLDHIGVDEKREGDKINNGAMDNATGTATLIEVARAIMRSPNKPKRSILFAAVTAEEKGLLGAQYLAKHPVIGNGKVVGVVNLDMPILTYDFTDVTAFGAEHSTLGPIVARAGATMGVKLSADPLPQEGLFTRSDHYRFVQEGIPSVFLMTGFAGEGKERFTHFLANEYHSPADEIDLPFNWNAAAKFARLNYAIAREIADAPEAPRWYSDSFFGQFMAPNQPKATRGK